MVQNNNQNGNGMAPTMFVGEGGVPETHIPTTVNVGERVLLTWEVGNGTRVPGQVRALLFMLPGGIVADGPSVNVPGDAGNGSLLGGNPSVTIPVEWTVNIAPGSYTAIVTLQELTPGADQNPAKLEANHQFSFTVREEVAAAPALFVISGPFIS